MELVEIVKEQAAWESGLPFAQLSALPAFGWATSGKSLPLSEVGSILPTSQGAVKIEDNVSKACGH